jgi:2'-hydroxyisoflavone reductase
VRQVGVLGGTRFIGYQLTCALAAAGHCVTLFNRGLTTPPSVLPPGVRVVTGDRNRPEDLIPFLGHDYDAVFDISGFTEAHVATVIDAPQRGCIGHYVFCSTSSVYARPMPVPCPESAPTTVEPGTYGGDKRRAEQVLCDASQTAGLSVTVLRPTGVFGPYDAAQARPVFARIGHDLPVPLRPGRRGRMTFLYVTDFVSVCLRVLESPEARGTTYNVAGPEIVDQREFVERCAAAAGRPAHIRDVLRWPYARLPLSPWWPADDVALDTTRVRRDLDVAFTPLERGLESTLTWLRRNPASLRPDLVTGERYIRDDGHLPAWTRPWLRVRNAMAPGGPGPR